MVCIPNLCAVHVGAESRNRTGTPVRARDFESRASTNSAIPAWNSRYSLKLYLGRGRIIREFHGASNACLARKWLRTPYNAPSWMWINSRSICLPI